jgi:hypothetical protein
MKVRFTVRVDEELVLRFKTLILLRDRSLAKLSHEVELLMRSRVQEIASQLEAEDRVRLVEVSTE